jgi:hydrogenase-4 component F
MSLENGLVLAATGAKGMPSSRSASHSRSTRLHRNQGSSFRIRERFDSVDVTALDVSGKDDERRRLQSLAVLLIPIGSAALLAALPGYRQTARRIIVASLATFLSALSLFVIERPRSGPYVLVISQHRLHRAEHFVGFTISIFSASYIAHGDTGRLAYLLSRYVPDHDVRHESRVRVYQHDVGRGRDRHADHGADGRHLCTHAALEAAWNISSWAASIALACSALSSSTWRRVSGGRGPGRHGVWTLLIKHAADFVHLCSTSRSSSVLGYGFLASAAHAG